MKPSLPRISEMLQLLGEIGYVPDKGTTRLAYTQEYEQAINELVLYLKNAGLSAYRDSVGNLYTGLDAPGKSIVVGSHLDTVPCGGMLDGVMGVVAGIECLITLKENGYKPNHRLEVIGFTEEEGNVIGGTFGSRCVAGLPQEQSVADALSTVGLTLSDVEKAARNKDDLLCYLELHIEQGGLLEAEKKTIGVVGGIVGIQRYKLFVFGQANHAGTTPMRLRDDALVKASAIIIKFDSIVRKYGDALVGTIGRIYNKPNAVNVISSQVELNIELRSLDSRLMEEALRELKEYTRDMSVRYEMFLNQKETMMDSRICNIISKSCENNGFTQMAMASGAGHDTISMASIVPCGMIFIPSIGGISHSPREHSDADDIAKGAKALLDTIMTIDEHGI